MVGYYDQPNECINELRNKNIKCVKGNHDKYLLGETTYNEANEEVYGLKKQRGILTKDNIKFLEELPDYYEIKSDEEKIMMTHSLPGDQVTYMYEPKILDLNKVKDYTYYCYGHTHIPLITTYMGLNIINPGSVGQPRDYSKTPSYIILDSKAKVCSLYKVPISYKSYTKHLSDKGYNDKVIKILER